MDPAEARARTREAFARLEEVHASTQAEFDAFLTRWRAEERRRRNERYERDVVRRAPILLNGGEGGATDAERVRDRLSSWLASERAAREALPLPIQDPSLADLIWWKGDHTAVVEVSLVVDHNDVDRAVARAETLSGVGVDALPMVIGDVWDSGETRAWAEAHRVAWKVGSDLSPSFIDFRRLR